MKKNAYWFVSVLLFVCITGIFLFVKQTKETEYKIVCLGDSIIGNVRDDSSIPAYIESMCRLSTYNGGFGGTTASCIETNGRAAISDNIVSLAELANAIAYDDFSVQNAGINRYVSVDYFPEALYGFDDIDWSNVEIVVIEHGVNDYLNGVALDNQENPYDVTSYGGALRHTLRQLQANRPDLRIILCTPTYCWIYSEGLSCQEINYGGGYLEDYVNLELQIAQEFGVEIIDNFHESGIGGEFENWSQYTEDGLHLNDAGRKLIAERISAVILGDTK